MQNKLGNFGSFGAVVAAAACPFCFPKLALLGALFGLGTLVKYEVLFFYAAHILIVIALIGHIIAYQKLQNRGLLALAVFSAIIFFVSLYIFVSENLSYLALTGLVTATIWMIIESRRHVSCIASAD
jgi:mercuric ion transport protein